ncbi:MAG TPA: Ppx/GppA phosphatase family protein [Thermoleophilaceae bacterium]|nr:Ppx/GppA phosphatase family protein [Thermoleophilaceae bacterium]
MRRTAVIDMGSNSWRLVVYDWEPGGHWKLTDEIREAVRIGERMGEEQTLKPEPIDRGIHTAAVFAAFCRTAGIEDVAAVATSAIRDAANREDLLRPVRELTGLDVRVLSGEEEARYGFLALANSTTLTDGVGLDVGGGSLQLMRVEGRSLAEAVSFPLGAVRMSERFLPNEKASGKAMKAARAHVAETVADLGWLEGRLVGIGGTARNLATAAQRMEGHPDTGIEGYALGLDALEALIEELASRPASMRGGVPGIKPDRADVILGGALAIAAVMDAGGLDPLEVTEAGLREGVFMERYLGGEHLLDDVRRRSVENLAAQYGADRRHAGQVARLTLELYDGLAEAGLADGADAERELLWAASMLHDIGVAVDYDDHHKHSRYLILNAGLPGFTPRELLLIATIARYHRKGEPSASDLGELAAKGDERRLALLSGVIRLAEQLERSRDGSVRSVSVRAGKDYVVICADAAGDPTVPIWSARRNADLLARAVGRQVEVERALGGRASPP